MSATTRQVHFMYLYERVGEPLFLGPRGQGANQVIYNVPADHLKPYEVHASGELRKLIPQGTELDVIHISKPSEPYDLSQVLIVPKRAIFSLFNTRHQQAASALKNILMSQKTLEDFFSTASLCRDKVNSQLWVYAFASCCINRSDMRGFRIPAFWEIMPDLFIDSSLIRTATQQATLPESDRGLILVDRNFTGVDTNPEHKVAYFREDIGVNSHHWHWHLVNSLDAPRGSRDRKGELFYYMHQNMIARFDAERLSNGLNRTVALDIQGSVKEAYFPKLTLANTGLVWGNRQENTKLRSVSRPDDLDNPFANVNLLDLNSWNERIKQGIDLGELIAANGDKIPMTPERGIDILGDTVEASFLSPNQQYYGSLHNYGHTVIAFAHDPVYKYKENFGVMGSTATAVRDPVFFRWHKHIDNIFARYKNTLQPYTIETLFWPGVRIGSVQIITPNREINSLSTHWMNSDIDLSRGLDFGRTNINGLGPVWARVKHLDHEKFNYHIKVINDTRALVTGTVRIFLAPKLNENAEPLRFAQQRTLFFEMDKFTVSLRPGENTIDRRSDESNITIPWEQTFRDIERNVSNLSAVRAVCGCGWPNHMLVPKGKKSGMPFDLFVMITNGELDRVAKRPRISGSSDKPVCKDGVDFCGVLDELYPDSRAMGFPFDRPPRKDKNNADLTFLEDFVIPNSNMAFVPVKIFHRNTTVVREGGAPSNMRPVFTGNTYKEKEMHSTDGGAPGWVVVNPQSGPARPHNVN